MRPVSLAYLAFATGTAVATVPEHLAKHLRRQSSEPTNTTTAASMTSDCTSTFIHFNTFTQGPVKTVWTTTETSTIPLDCGTCQYVTVKNAGGRGPVVNFKTTTTVDTPTTTTTYACAPATSTASG